MNKILRCFIGADMRLAHEGLQLIAKKHGITTGSLSNGEHVIFLNHAHDKLKLFSANNVITYLRMDRGRKIDLRVIQLIPSIYGAMGGIDYARGIEQVIRKELGIKEKKAIKVEYNASQSAIGMG